MIHFNLPAARPLLNEVKDLACHMHTFNVDNAGYASCYTYLVCLAPVTVELWDPPACIRTAPLSAPQTFATQLSVVPYPSPLTCFMCEGSHYIFDCPVTHAYI